MKLNTNSPQVVFLLIIFMSFCLSCNKDSDLLTEYVVMDVQSAFDIKIINDNYVVLNGSNTILDVLENDSFSEVSEVAIIQTSNPATGSVVINENNTLTYTPNSSETETEELVTDTFTYTTQVTDSNQTTTIGQGTVTVSIAEKEVIYWKELFDKKWKDSDRENAVAKSKSQNKNQQYYYLGYFIDGLSSMWQATGDNSYLDNALSLVKTTMNDASSIRNGYLGWVSEKGDPVALWDSFYWRNVATLIRIMYQSPNLRANGYQSQYQEILEFSERHIWDRYEAEGSGHFYRSRTHMASHWARIGMELYIITGKQKYKDVFDNISFDTMKGRPSNLRNQIYPNPKNISAYAWDDEWGVSQGSEIQDTSHAGALVSFWILAYENGMYWNKSDIDALLQTMDIVWPESDPNNIRRNIDGSGGYFVPGRLHEWLPLGRYSAKLQSRIKNQYNGKHLNFYGTQALGIASLNAKILADGQAIYPENR